MEKLHKTYKPRLITLIAPGFLLAATGVGAGDLAIASFAGSHLGLTVLWAVVIGGLLKFILTEAISIDPGIQFYYKKVKLEGYTDFAMDYYLYVRLIFDLF